MANFQTIKIGNNLYQVEDSVAREHLVEVNQIQPASNCNKLWIKTQENEYEVPTIEEFTELQTTVEDVNDELLDAKTDLAQAEIDIETCKNALTIESGINYFPDFSTDEFNLGYYLENGSVHEWLSGGKIAYIDRYVEISPEQTYTFVLVPSFGSAKTPWYGIARYGEIYDKDKNYIENISANTNGEFITPENAKYVRFNVTGEDWNGQGTKIKTNGMLIKGTYVPETYTPYDIQRQVTFVGSEISSMEARINTFSSILDERTILATINLYDPSIQTPNTISPHYFVNGDPYTTTQFDNAWNCTANIEIEPDTQYTLGLVPAVGSSNIVKPWGNASYGVFFYDENGKYVSGANDSGIDTPLTFTTPSSAKTMRFNYYISANTVSLNVLNSSCMLVKGDTLPSNYIPFSIETVKDKIKESGKTIRYIVEDSGMSATVISKYNSQYDLAVTIKKKGGNNLFDFYKFGIISNSSNDISKNAELQTELMTTATDWFAPFVFQVKNNIDGDKPDSWEFTGGNHQYNNQGEGSTATARTISIAFKADGMDVISGSGSCSKFEMIWTNLVQASNTKKEDGTGREALKENHRMIFDGTKFEFYIDLIPLEDITMQTWYGAQWSTAAIYPNVRFIGGLDRSEHVVSSSRSESGNSTCCHVVGYGDLHEIRLDIDSGYDLGDHSFIASSRTDSIFTATYGKGYCYIISNKDLDEAKMYSLHGWYEFRSKI